MFNKQKITIIMLIFVLLMGFNTSCARKKPLHDSPPKLHDLPPDRKCEPGKIWIPSHIAPNGKRVPGYCAHQ